MCRAMADPLNVTIQRQSRVVKAQTAKLLASALFAPYASFSDFAICALSVRADASFQEFAGQYFLVCRALISILRDAWITHVTAWLLNQGFTLKSVFSALHGDHSVRSFCAETVLAHVISRAASNMHTRILVLGAGIGQDVEDIRAGQVLQVLPSSSLSLPLPKPQTLNPKP
jgi:hypothetical protein